MVSSITDLVISPKWGSCSEVSFTVYKNTNSVENPYYDKIVKTRLIHIDGFGYFTIQGYDENKEDKVPNKSITAYSAEYTLNTKGINLTFITTAGNINDTSSTTIVTSNYFFYREQQPDKSLLHQLIKVAPMWKIGYVSGSLRDKSRSFSETDKGLYGFLTNEVSQSYEALFIFDNENFIINAYDTTEVVKNTNIMLTFNNLLKSAKVSELSDDVYTVINVSGAENLSIAKINPNGTKKLFCLDYYTGVLDKNATNYYKKYNEWIKDNNLKKKVLEWERDCKTAIYDTSSTSYGSWTALQKKFNLLLLTQQAKLNDMQTYLDTSNQQMSLYTDYSDVNKLNVIVEVDGVQGKATYGEAKSHNWKIVSYYEVEYYTTDSRHTVTKYAYWRNYAQACEANLSILKNGGKLYSVHKGDFESADKLNSDYNVASFSHVVATGKLLSNRVNNHSVVPTDNASEYSTSALETEIKLIQTERDKIVDRYSYEKHFTDAEKLALDPYIIEGSFSDDTFIVTDSMETKDYSNSTTKVQVVDSQGNISVKSVGELTQTDTIMDDIYVAGQLVDAGYEKLKVVSQPSFSFELESANFLFIEKFKPYIDQLTQIEKDRGSLFGAIINVELEDGNWVYPYLQEMEINYDDPDSFTMKFGNRFRLSNDVYTFDELHNETTSAVSSVGSLLSAVSQPVVNGTIDAVTQYTKNTLNLTNQSIKATDDNEFIIGKYGIKGRQKSDEQGNVNGYSPEQIWMSNNKICFTDDGWDTTKAVFGKVTDEAGNESYGLIADTLVGKLIMGNNLIISNENNSMTFDQTGLSITNQDTSVAISPGGVNTLTITRKGGSGIVDVMTVDNKGNLLINGGSLNIGHGDNIGYLIDGNNGTIRSRATVADASGSTHPLFELTADGKLNAAGISVNGDSVITQGGDISVSGDKGTVDDTADAGNTPPDGSILEKASWLLGFFWNPYNRVLRWVGNKDTDGWRKIWNYYSPRNIADGTLPNALSSYFASKSALDNYYNKNWIDDNFVKKTTLTDDYKTWSSTETYLRNNYQPLSGMNDYYTKIEVDDSFVLKSALDNYSTTEEIQNKFGITTSDTFRTQNVTIDGTRYTILVKSN